MNPDGAYAVGISISIELIEALQNMVSHPVFILNTITIAEHWFGDRK